MNWKVQASGLLAYGLLAVGLWLVTPAAAFIGVGGVLWVDLQIDAWERRRG